MPHQPEDIPDEDVDFGRTFSAVEKLRTMTDVGKRLYEEPDTEAPHGYYGHSKSRRRIIGYDTPIYQGVYVGAGEREVIVVDDTEAPRMQQAYDLALAKSRELNDVVGGTYQTVLALMRYDDELVAQDVEEFRNKKVNLNYFLQGGRIARSTGQTQEQGYGVCRHQALLAAYILEKMTREGAIRGSARIDRNTIKGRGGHAWAVFRTPDGREYIIDPAQEYAGPIEAAPTDGWKYARPTDYNVNDDTVELTRPRTPPDSSQV